MKFIKKIFKKEIILVIVLATFLTIVAFYQVFLSSKIPLNANCLVSVYSPFITQKWPEYKLGVIYKPGMLDQLRIYYPYLRLTYKQWRNFKLPIWNPYNFAGNPHMAEWQSGAFYPFHFVSLFLSLQNHWIFMILSPFILSFIFTYLYLKNLKLDFKPALFGSLSFAFCGFMITWSQEVMTAPHSIMWLPLLLLAIDKYLTTGNKKWYLLGIVTTTLSLFSGYFQTTIYLLCFSIIYAVFRISKLKKSTLTKLKLLIIIGLIFIIGLTLAAPQIIPTWELFNLSAKKTVDFSQTLIAYLLPWYWLMTFFAPDFFGHPTTRNLYGPTVGSYYERILFFGVIPLFFSLFSLANLSNKKKRNQILFFLISGILFLIPTFDTPISRAVFTLKVPFLSTVIANRTMFINAFCFSILAAFGLEFWLKNKKKLKLKTFLIVSAFFTLVYGLALLRIYQSFRGKLTITYFPLDWYITSFRNLAIPLGFFFISVFLIFLGIFKKKKLIFWLIFFLAFLHQFYFLQKFTPFSPRKFVYPQHETLKFLEKKADYDRFLGNNGLFLENNFATFYQIYSPTGYDSLNSARYAELLYAVGSDGKIIKQRPSRSDAILSRDFKSPLLQRMASILSIRYLIDHPKLPHKVGESEDLKKILQEKVNLVFTHNDWKIYEYKEALPRAFLTEDFIVENNPQKIVDLLFSPEFNPRETIILEEKPQLTLKKGDGGEAKIIDYHPNLVKIKTNSSSPKLLFLSDSFFPGWQAKVDGQVTKIYRANYAFRSIIVPEGEHEIVFSYFPKSLKIGFLTFLGGTILAIFVLKKLNYK